MSPARLKNWFPECRYLEVLWAFKGWGLVGGFYPGKTHSLERDCGFPFFSSLSLCFLTHEMTVLPTLLLCSLDTKTTGPLTMD